MPDQYTEVTKTGYFNRIGKAFKGIVFGLVLFVASFVVLYNNEGRVDVSDIAANALPASVETDQQQVYVTDVVKTEEKLGDGMFLKNGDYLAVRRDVEVYAWVEESDSSSETNLGGSETTETTYTYSKKWVASAPESAQFKVVEGHENVPESIEDADVAVSTATIAGYGLNMKKLSLPGFEDVSLNNDNVTLNGRGVLEGQYVFLGKGAYAEPQVGDMRVSYRALGNNFNGTVFGKLNGKNIEPFVTEEATVYRLFDGSRDEALKQMHGEYVTRGWIMRLLGFLLMWIGLSSLFAPLTVILDVVPVFGDLGKAVTGVITFLVSLVLSVVTIFVSMVLHSVVAIVISVLVVFAVFAFILKKRGKKAKVIRV